MSNSPYSWYAWWQVNLEDFYLVKAITFYLPTVSPGLYADVRIFFEQCRFSIVLCLVKAIS